MIERFLTGGGSILKNLAGT